MRKSGVIFCLIFLFLFFSVGLATAKTWYVDDSGGVDFTKIQDAINAASNGDTIIVKNGTYIENVKVNKSLIIKSEYGAEKTIIKSKGSKFNVTANDVEIAGFTITGISLFDDVGISLNDALGVIILDNTTTNNYIGVMLCGKAHYIV
jgi:nitrous oxidase accessory protein